MKETLEEAAKTMAYDKMPDWGGLPMVAKKYFIKGAEWQAKQSPWISVKERLPENQDIVLVRGEYGGKATAYLHGRIAALSFTGRTLIRYSRRLPIGCLYPILRNSINRAYYEGS